MRSSGGGGAASSTSGARLTPQFPVTTVVTPWLALAAISGVANSARSSWVCTSIKPGATILPETSISRAPVGRATSPTAVTRAPVMATSPRRRGPPRPSTTSPPRRTQSVISRPFSEYAILPDPPPNARRIGMLSREENELITRVGQATPMGNAMRRYWIPALLAREIAEPDGPPVRVRLLGEDLVAFRDTEGRIGLLDEYCPHRRASLFFGRNEECGLRCVYHGWKFDVAGTCIDQLNEPVENQFQHKIHIAAYPTVELGGVVWAYLGPPE